MKYYKIDIQEELKDTDNQLQTILIKENKKLINNKIPEIQKEELETKLRDFFHDYYQRRYFKANSTEGHNLAKEEQKKAKTENFEQLKARYQALEEKDMDFLSELRIHYFLTDIIKENVKENNTEKEKLIKAEIEKSTQCLTSLEKNKWPNRLLAIASCITLGDIGA